MVLFTTFIYLTETDLLYGWITIGVGIVYGTVLFLNGSNKIYWARLCTSLGTVAWISLYHICFGGFISQSLAVGAAIIINYVAFRKKAEYMKLLFLIHIGVYFVALSYGINHEPIIEYIDFPEAGLVSFVVSMGWVTLILIVFHQEREKLISNLQNKR